MADFMVSKEKEGLKRRLSNIFFFCDVSIICPGCTLTCVAATGRELLICLKFEKKYFLDHIVVDCIQMYFPESWWVVQTL